eukprot:gene20993-biopygen19155
MFGFFPTGCLRGTAADADRTRTERGAHDSIQRNGRGPDAGRTVSPCATSEARQRSPLGRPKPAALTSPPTVPTGAAAINLGGTCYDEYLATGGGSGNTVSQLDGQTLNSCSAACNDDTNCLLFTFYVSGPRHLGLVRGGQCLLKSHGALVPGRSDRNTYVSAPCPTDTPTDAPTVTGATWSPTSAAPCLTVSGMCSGPAYYNGVYVQTHVASSGRPLFHQYSGDQAE